ncbi:unnamed protein product (macronuclear) [Paramecium tetraurelia]|uniref:Transmembrane protein n=1 Tax=Paramecium tetraurelia TaxID=5888 RepID=A0DSL7_PARTE|nr:uncharacterized protein GSPATT00039739001 [Paramecium tetraurelia]CAK86034.1 unnamed protein product [Paramecium tetraurelia]|eukprot:XP_001453431.1 hypothetical protein (macronuclear) [Paramecium tetraurelia strain d4-2]
MDNCQDLLSLQQKIKNIMKLLQKRLSLFCNNQLLKWGNNDIQNYFNKLTFSQQLTIIFGIISHLERNFIMLMKIYNQKIYILLMEGFLLFMCRFKCKSYNLNHKDENFKKEILINQNKKGMILILLLKQFNISQKDEQRQKDS